MFNQRTTIISDSSRASASSQAGDTHDHGSSACKGGERIVERRSGSRPRSLNVCGF